MGKADPGQVGEVNRLDDKLTAVSTYEAIAAIGRAYEVVMARKPSVETLAILVAQTALETGMWKYMHHYNFGNIRGTYKNKFVSFRAGEIIGGKEVILEPGANNKFRAYPDALAGAVDFVRFLALDTTPNNDRPNRYAKAWAAAEAGDLEAYNHELHKAGYYTASESRYLKTMSQLYHQLLPDVAEQYGNTDPAPPPEAEPDHPTTLQQIAADLRAIREHMGA